MLPTDATDDFHEVLEYVTSEFLDERDNGLPDLETPAAINAGHCRCFATRVAAVFDGDVEVVTHGFEANAIVAHCWLVYDGLVFDAETPEGVSSPVDLPLFKRARRAGRAPHAPPLVG